VNADNAQIVETVVDGRSPVHARGRLPQVIAPGKLWRGLAGALAKAGALTAFQK